MALEMRVRLKLAVTLLALRFPLLLEFGLILMRARAEVVVEGFETVARNLTNLAETLGARTILLLLLCFLLQNLVRENESLLLRKAMRLWLLNTT